MFMLNSYVAKQQSSNNERKRKLEIYWQQQHYKMHSTVKIIIKTHTRKISKKTRHYYSKQNAFSTPLLQILLM